MHLTFSRSGLQAAFLWDKNMKLAANKPIYYQGSVVVEGVEFETQEQHGRELIAKGYAKEVVVNNSAEQPKKVKK